MKNRSRFFGHRNMSVTIWKTFFTILALCFLESSLRAADTPSQQLQVDGLKAFFRSGQTFMTWNQLDGRGYHYRIYRSDKPFRNEEDLSAKQFVAEVHDHTSLNFSASVVFLEANKDRNSEYEIKKPVYYIIEDGGKPLSKETGLFVYTAKANEKAWYAVTVVKDSIEYRVIGHGNVLEQPVNEKVEFPGAVRQKEEYFVHWTDSEGTEFYPAMSSVPGVPYNFHVVAAKEKVSNPALVITLHGSQMQYTIGLETPEGEQAVLIGLDSPVFFGKFKGLTEIEYPPNQGWMGYNENFGTGKPLSEGKIIPYTERRVLWIIDWAIRNYNVDPDRVSMRGSSMGSAGVLKIGLTYPDRFASIHAIVPILGFPGQPRNSTAAISGTRENRQPSESWISFSPSQYLEQHPETEFPYIQFTAGRLDNAVGWSNKGPFAKTLESLKNGYAFFWDLRAHTGPFVGTPPPGLIGPPIYWDRGGSETMPMPDFSRKQSFPALAHLSVNNDPGTVDFAVRGNEARPAWDTPGAGDLIGTINGTVTWDRTSMVDRKDRYEITLKLLPSAKDETATADVTPRRLQQFKPIAGKSYSYVVSEEGSAKEIASGQTTADQHGHVTVINVPITRHGTRLILKGKD